MTANGATITELADHFGVPPASVELWAACHEEFAAALRVGKTLADDRVERSWYNRCVGYTYDSEKIMVIDKQVEHVPTREHVPPDASACAAWLRNRRPAEWNEKQKHEIDATFRRVEDDGPVINLESASPDEIQREYAAALAASSQCKLLPPAAAGDPR